MKKIEQSRLYSPEISKFHDGVYQGQYQQGRWNYTVEVSIAAGQIDTVYIIDCANCGTRMMDNTNLSIVNKLLEQGSLEFDAVSGATITTKSFKKAVDNALIKAKEE